MRPQVLRDQYTGPHAKVEKHLFWSKQERHCLYNVGAATITVGVMLRMVWRTVRNLQQVKRV